MNILRKVIALILIMLTILILMNTIQVKTFANSNFNNIRRINVAVIFHRINDPYMVRIRESLEDIGKDPNNNVNYTFFDSKNNIAIQNELLDSALQKNFDLFILNLADKRENFVEEVILRVKQKGIPLILMNISPDVVSKISALYDKDVFIIPDSKQAGIAQGKIIVDLWKKDKNVIDKNNDNILQYVLLQGPPDDPQAIERSKYAISTINDSGITTQELTLVNGNWLRDLANSSINNLFLKYSDRIEAIISNNDAMAIGAIDALQKYGYNKGDKSKNITVVGIDALPEAIELIDRGFMTGTVAQDPKVVAKMLYTVGRNIINNLNPTENTKYKNVNGEILVPYPYDTYTGKSNHP
ncbi:galactose ABC transporter substrate-binding protein [Clostridium chromiireducens]|uniref:D-galactose/methyl-galactoside binding periplasmic protein MglB n=1 Tax=Clostridium chromiireducens TaxID=225345 RepID=A0A399IS80_9CLOT|nr:galactose ABC transporter substrate-binding protein [Clostridium chromiireducens]RII33786.1 galactose ABC transporter substrate-binding protein [Clostridium chromiireducens]